MHMVQNRATLNQKCITSIHLQRWFEFNVKHVLHQGIHGNSKPYEVMALL